ncbi:hypothetical protein RYX36_017883 [Vicia faba]
MKLLLAALNQFSKLENTAFSWLRNIFHDCAVQSCDASLLLTSTKRSLSEQEHDRSFGLRNFRYFDTIKEAVERECPGVVSCSDILVLSARDGVVSLGGPYIPLKTGRRDGRKSRVGLLEEYLPDHNESISSVLDKFGAMGIDTPGVVSLLGAHSVGRTYCTKLVHRLYPEVDPALNPDQPVITPAGENPVRELVADDSWLNGEFISTVQQRGAAIIKARKLSSALSAASAACDHIRNWVLGTPSRRTTPPPSPSFRLC